VSTLYIHIPFCNKKCPYCDFFSIAGLSSKTKTQYTSALLKELKSNKDILKTNVKTLYFGGGSPVLLGMNNLEIIIKKIKPLLNKKAEVTIEVNPDQLENKKTINKHLKKLGITRISIGVQTIKKDILTLIERKYDLSNLVKNIHWFKDNKIDVSLDFMFALPRQRIKDLKQDLDFIEKEKPHHVSFYMFTPPERYKHTNLCPDEKETEKMFALIHSRLLKIGYSHYEVSNFALKNKESKHNSVYWNYTSYLGLGSGAHSFLKEKSMRKWNRKDINYYIKHPNSSYDFEILDKEKTRAEKIMLGLRLLNKGMGANLVDKKLLSQLIKGNFVSKQNNMIKINLKALPIMDEIIRVLIA